SDLLRRESWVFGLPRDSKLGDYTFLLITLRAALKRRWVKRNTKTRCLWQRKHIVLGLKGLGNHIVCVPAQQRLARLGEISHRRCQLQIRSGADSRVAAVKPKADAHQFASGNNFESLANATRRHYIEYKRIRHSQLVCQFQIW